MTGLQRLKETDKEGQRSSDRTRTRGSEDEHGRQRQGEPRETETRSQGRRAGNTPEEGVKAESGREAEDRGHGAGKGEKQMSQGLGSRDTQKVPSPGAEQNLNWTLRSRGGHQHKE